jgi:hypothetical protein
MRYLGTLAGVNGGNASRSLAVSDSLGQIAAIPNVPLYSTTPNADTVVNLYSSSALTPVGQFATTPFEVNSASFPAHGRWVFYNSSSSAMFIITQADAQAGLELNYAIENVNLTTANSCNASFSTSSASVISAGTYGTVQIDSGEDCAFTAVSNVPWIVLSSGYYGSGNTTLTYLARPNLTSQTRSGTISMGSATFTVNQDAAAAASPSIPLSIKPVAAAYDKALDKIIMASSSPNELHIYDPVSQADQIVPLTYIPTSLSVRPDGLAAAVGHDAHVSIVDLQGQVVTQTIPVDMTNGGIALASNGYAYAFPAAEYTWGTINSIQLSTGTLTGLQDTYYGSRPVFDVTGNYLYVAGDEGGSKLNISNGPATLVQAAFGGLGTHLWLSDDGNRLISSTGNVYFASTVPSQDLQSDGKLTSLTSVDWAADSRVHRQIAVLTDPSSTASTQLQVYAANGLQLQEQTTLSVFSNNGNSYVSHGKYLFWNAPETELFAITEADGTSGLLSDFALNMIAMPEALPACSFAVSPASINVPPTGYVNWTVNVTSNCEWSPAVPSSSWVSVSGGLISGNGQFTLSAQSNSAQARSLSITVGTQSVTVNQAASTCTYAVSSGSASLPAFAITGQVNLTAGAGCVWSIQTTTPWLTITSPTAGSGSTAVTFAVTENQALYSRSGSINVGGQAFAVSQAAGPAGIGGYDFASPEDRAFAFDYQGSGYLDHIVVYRPGTGIVWILENSGNGRFTPVYQSTYDSSTGYGGGIGGYDLRSTSDQMFAFDYDGTGKLDHLVLYRPGTGIIWILANNSGTFTPVYQSTFDVGTGLGGGIGGYDLLSSSDQLLAFDYAGGNTANHLLAYRPGYGIVWILGRSGSKFAPVYQSSYNSTAGLGGGIGGYDLLSPSDRIVTGDSTYTLGAGNSSQLALYRPGSGIVWVLKSNGDGTFAVEFQSTWNSSTGAGGGIGGYDLRSSSDQLVLASTPGSSNGYALLYRPAVGNVWTVQCTAGVGGTLSNCSADYRSSYNSATGLGGGIGGYDFLSASDRVFALDYSDSGALDHLIIYRPGAGSIWMLQNSGDRSFSRVVIQ